MKKSIFLLTVLFALSCGNEQTEVPTDQTPHRHDSNSSVQLSATQKENLNLQFDSIQWTAPVEIVNATGTMELPPQGRQTITLIHGGYITNTRLLPGQAIRKGELLCTIENPVYLQLQEQYLTALARKDALKAEYDRKVKLAETQAVSQRDLEKARTQWEENKIRIHSISQQLRLIGIQPDQIQAESLSSQRSIYAPFSGYVTSINISPGQYVNPADPLFEIINLEHMHAHLKVYEKDAAALRKGQIVHLYSRRQPKEICSGEIFLIDKSFDEEGVLSVHVELSQDHFDHVQVGSYLEAEIEVPADSSWVFPKHLLRQSAQGEEIILIERDDGQLQQQRIEIEFQSSEMVGVSKFWDGGRPPRIVKRPIDKILLELKGEKLEGHAH